MKTIAFAAVALALVACSTATPAAGDHTAACLTACDVARIDCETPLHNTCAHCCDVQPYVAETGGGALFTKPIASCSDSPLPATADWSVSWCLDDCSQRADDTQCVPAFNACTSACQ